MSLRGTAKHPPFAVPRQGHIKLYTMNTFQVNELVIIKTTDPEDAALNNKVGRITAPFGGLPCQPNALGVYLLDKDVYGLANVPQNELFSWGERFAFVCRVNGARRYEDINLPRNRENVPHLYLVEVDRRRHSGNG